MLSAPNKYMKMGLVLAPAFIYFAYLFYFAQNIPHWDDYAITRIVDTFTRQGISFFDKIQLLFSQHNEHRIVITRLVALLSYGLYGYVNFKFLMWVGSLALLAILWVAYRVLVAENISTDYLLPISLVLFQLGHYENTYWGMAAVQNFWVVAFSILAFYRLANTKIPYLWFPLAAFTSANASVLIPIIGLILLLFHGKKGLILQFLALSIIALSLYFGFYQKPPDSEPIHLENPWLNIKATLMNLGSNVDWNANLNIDQRAKYTSLFGVLLILIALVLMIRYWLQHRSLSFARHHVFYFCLALFLFAAGTCAITSLSRVQYGFYVFLVSRYRIYGTVALISVYIFALYCFQWPLRRLLFGIATALCLCIFFYSAYYSVAYLQFYQKNELANHYSNWHMGEKTALFDPKSKYHYQNGLLDQQIIKVLSDSTLQLKVNVHSDAIWLESKQFQQKTYGAVDGIYFEFLSDGSRYIFAARQQVLASKLQFLKRGFPDYTFGFNGTVALTDIPSGQYFINILVLENGILSRINTRYYLDVEGKSRPAIQQNW